jgi:hypothetical protein
VTLSRFKFVAIFFVLMALMVGLTACQSAVDSGDEVTATSPIPPVPYTPNHPHRTVKKIIPSWGDGTWRVPSDMKYGTYKAVGGDSCYWETDKDLDGNLSSIIANEALRPGPKLVHIGKNVKAFKTSGCGKWRKA